MNNASGVENPESGSGRDEYRRLLEGATDNAVFKLDTEGFISMWPTVAHELYGYEPDAVLGEPLETLYADKEQSPPPTEALLSEAKRGSVECEGWHERADESVFWATYTVSPLRNGEVNGYVVVSRDTTDEKQYRQMLERQNDRLKEFTDILSHDLRSPLSVIEGRLQLFDETGDPVHLETIGETTERMEALVEDLLRVAEQGQVVEDPQPTDIGPVVETATEGVFSEQATCVYHPIPRVMADRNRLIQLFENLFRNAVEHGGDDVAIEIGLLEDGFYVADDGPGIPEDYRSRVFEHGFTTRENGHGYGLSIVRSIVGAHGWDITVTDAENGGARFEITGIEFVDDA